MRTRFVVKADVLGDDAPEVILTQDEDVVEQLSPERTDEPFSEGIHVRRAYRRAHDAHPRRPEYASEASAELRVVVADDNLWRIVHGGVSGLLRAPLVGRRMRHRGMEDRSATQVQEEENEHLAESHVERLYEVARPRHVVSQERRPALAVTSGQRAPHVPLNRSLANADAWFEQLTTDALGAPAWVVRRHIPDKGGTRGSTGVRATESDAARMRGILRDASEEWSRAG